MKKIIIYVFMLQVIITPKISLAITVSYDSRNRLTYIDYSGGCYIEYTYDPAGNITSKLSNCPPRFSNILAVPNPAGYGDNLTITFTASEDLISNPTVTVAGTAASFQSKVGLVYTYLYPVQGQAPEINGSNPIVISGNDLYGVFGQGQSSVIISFDSDNDGLSDRDEVLIYGTNPRNADTDGDRMPDGWEVSHGLNPLVNDADGNPTGDGITNLQKYLNGLDPRVAYWGTLRVSSDPSSAKVYIDGDIAYPGKYAGLSGTSGSPLVISSLKNEKHFVTIIADNYFIYQTVVNFTLGQTLTVNPALAWRNIEVYTESAPVLAAGLPVNIPSGFSAPNAVDFDLNGTVDLFVGGGDGQVLYFANASPSGWDLAASTQVQAGGITLDVGARSKPFAVDWNNDNKLDLLVGNSVGEVWLFPGNGTTNFAAGTALMMDGHTITVPGGNAAPIVYDWDNDHKKDLLVGAGDGTVTVFLNTGTDAAPVFASGSLLVDHDGNQANFGAMAAPFAGDIDRNGHYDLVLGNGDGTIGGCAYSVSDSGFGCGKSVLPTDLNDVSTPIDVGDNSSPAFADLNQDGQYDMVLGNLAGTLTYYVSSHLTGDLDRSTKVDCADWALVRQSMGLCKGDAGYNPGADLNGDNCVNALDETILSNNFGKTY